MRYLKHWEWSKSEYEVFHLLEGMDKQVKRRDSDKEISVVKPSLKIPDSAL